MDMTDRKRRTPKRYREDDDLGMYQPTRKGGWAWSRDLQTATTIIRDTVATAGGQIKVLRGVGTRRMHIPMETVIMEYAGEFCWRDNDGYTTEEESMLMASGYHQVSRTSGKRVEGTLLGRSGTVMWYNGCLLNHSSHRNCGVVRIAADRIPAWVPPCINTCCSDAFASLVPNYRMFVVSLEQAIPPHVSLRLDYGTEYDYRSNDFMRT
jgi:hypothetical protein